MTRRKTITYEEMQKLDLTGNNFSDAFAPQNRYHAMVKGIPSSNNRLFALETKLFQVITALQATPELDEAARKEIVAGIFNFWKDNTDEFTVHFGDLNLETVKDLKKIPTNYTEKLVYYLIINLLNKDISVKDVSQKALNFNEESKGFKTSYIESIDVDLNRNFKKLSIVFNGKNYRLKSIRDTDRFSIDIGGTTLSQGNNETSINFLKRSLLKIINPTDKELSKEKEAQFEKQFQYFLLLQFQTILDFTFPDKYNKTIYKPNSYSEQGTLYQHANPGASKQLICLDISSSDAFKLDMTSLYNTGVDQTLSDTADKRTQNNILLNFHQEIPANIEMLEFNGQLIPLPAEPENLEYEVKLIQLSNLASISYIPAKKKEPQQFIYTPITIQDLAKSMGKNLGIPPALDPLEVDRQASNPNVKDRKVKYGDREIKLTSRSIGLGSAENKLLDVLYDYTMAADDPNLIADEKPKLAIGLAKNLANISKKFGEYLETNHVDLDNIETATLLTKLQSYTCNNIEKMTVNLLRYILDDKSLPKDLTSSQKDYTNAADLLAKQWKSVIPLEADFMRNSQSGTAILRKKVKDGDTIKELQGKFREIDNPKALIFDLYLGDDTKPIASLGFKKSDYQAQKGEAYDSGRILDQALSFFNAPSRTDKIVDAKALEQKPISDEIKRLKQIYIQATNQTFNSGELTSPMQGWPLQLENSNIYPAALDGGNISTKKIFIDVSGENVAATTQLQFEIPQTQRENNKNFRTIGVFKRQYSKAAKLQELPDGTLIPSSKTLAEFSYGVVESDYSPEETKKFTKAIDAQIIANYGKNPNPQKDLAAIISAASAINAVPEFQSDTPLSASARAKGWVGEKLKPVTDKLSEIYENSSVKSMVDKIYDNPKLRPILEKARESLVPKTTLGKVILGLGLAAVIVGSIVALFNPFSFWILVVISAGAFIASKIADLVHGEIYGPAALSVEDLLANDTKQQQITLQLQKQQDQGTEVEEQEMEEQKVKPKKGGGRGNGGGTEASDDPKTVMHKRRGFTQTEGTETVMEGGAKPAKDSQKTDIEGGAKPAKDQVSPDEEPFPLKSKRNNPQQPTPEGKQEVPQVHVPTKTSERAGAGTPPGRNITPTGELSSNPAAGGPGSHVEALNQKRKSSTPSLPGEL